MSTMARNNVMYTIARTVDESDDEAIAAAGIDPGPDDLVVLLIRFGGGPVEDRIIGYPKSINDIRSRGRTGRIRRADRAAAVDREPKPASGR